MDGITFRAARPADVVRLADIINDPPPHAAVHIAGSAERAIEGGRIFARAHVAPSVTHTIVAEETGRVVGLMDGCREWREPSVSLGLVLQLLPGLLRAVGPRGLWRFARSRGCWSRVSFDAPAGSFYISELDVAASHRNRGIGAALLEVAEERARASGATQMSLTTTIDNPARRLYERTGYREAGRKTDAAYTRISGSPGRVLLVKDLAYVAEEVVLRRGGVLDGAKLTAFVATANAERARAFYEGTLGLTLVADEEYGLIFDANGTPLRIAKVQAVSPPPYTSLGWEVADVAATVRGLTARGVAFERYDGMGQDELGIWAHDRYRVAWFKDPDGNLLSISGH